MQSGLDFKLRVTLQYLIVLPTESIRRCKIMTSSVNFLSTKSPIESVRRHNVRR